MNLLCLFYSSNLKEKRTEKKEFEDVPSSVSDEILSRSRNELLQFISLSHRSLKIKRKICSRDSLLSSVPASNAYETRERERQKRRGGERRT